MTIFKKKMIYYIVLIIVGIIMILAGTSQPDGDIATAMGAAFIAVAVLKFVQLFLLTRNEERRKRYEIMQKEERRQFIAARAGNLMFFITLVLELAAAVGFVIAEMPQVAAILSYAAGGQTVLYLIVYYILSKRY